MVVLAVPARPGGPLVGVPPLARHLPAPACFAVAHRADQRLGRGRAVSALAITDGGAHVGGFLGKIASDPNPLI